MKKFLIFSTVITVFVSFASTPARGREDDDEQEEHEHHGEGKHKGNESARNQGENKKDNAANLPPASTLKDVTFAKDIAPLFEKSCVRCHGEDKQKAGLRVDSLEEIMKGGEDGAVVVSGQSAKSPLVLSVARVDSEKAMPPDRKPGKDVGADGKKLPPVVHFTPEQVGLVRAWIDQGAK
ncbi:MAG: c-type cytochrome domain-containing protein [Verrucomicrobiota bacterium]